MAAICSMRFVVIDTDPSQGFDGGFMHRPQIRQTAHQRNPDEACKSHESIARPQKEERHFIGAPA